MAAQVSFRHKLAVLSPTPGQIGYVERAEEPHLHRHWQLELLSRGADPMLKTEHSVVDQARLRQSRLLA